MKIRKAVMLLYFSIVGFIFLSAQNFEYKSYANVAITNYSMPYRLFIPSGYNSNTSYPLVLFLHGAGERGTDNNVQITANRGASLWADPSNQASNPCFILAPQCPPNLQWVNTNWSLGSYSITNVQMSNELKMVKDIIETLENQYNIDASRLFITGLSMGGYGTWDFILRYPNMFKAAIPICGAGDPSKASLIGTLPLRVFHSSDDPTVPVAGSRDMINAINALGPNDRGNFYTEYTNQGHSSWINAYNTPDLVNWLFTVNSITNDCGNILVNGISITASSISLFVNGTSNLIAKISPANACNKAVIWSSSNTLIATVSSSGLVLGKSVGVATITATSVDGGKTTTCAVTVSGAKAIYEAENAKLNGVSVSKDQSGYSGTGFVSAFGSIGNSIEFTITGAIAGAQDITVSYAGNTGITLNLYVNGVLVGPANFSATWNWGDWRNHTDKVTLNEGTNSIKYQKEVAGGYLNFDYLSLTGDIIHETSIKGVKESDITLSPNPLFTGSLSIKLPEEATQLSIFDVTGKMVYQEKVIRNEYLIDQSVFNSEGVYFVNVLTTNNCIVKKIIVAK